MIDKAISFTCIVAMCILAVFILLILIRAIRGPRLTDRLICSNMIGTVVIMIIAILSQWIGEGYLVDICIIYAMVSFVSVVVLYKVYTARHTVIDINTIEEIKKDNEDTDSAKEDK